MKNGIPYFPFDCELDIKFDLIEAEFGITGFGVVVKLYQRIYGMQGYYAEWTDEVALLFSKKIGMGRGAVSEIVSASIKRGIFDKDLFDKYQILTSKGIQERYFEAVCRRKQVEVINEYLLVDATQFCKNVCRKRENVSISKKNVDILKQSKEEKSKEEESKEVSGVPPPHSISLLLKNGEAHSIQQRDIDEWSVAYPAVDIVAELRKMAAWCKANPSKRKTAAGINRFVINWLSGSRKDMPNGNYRRTTETCTAKRGEPIQKQYGQHY